jgi:hypothetical protein
VGARVESEEGAGAELEEEAAFCGMRREGVERGIVEFLLL